MIELLDREEEQQEQESEQELPRVYLFGALPEGYEEDFYTQHGNGD